MVFMAIANVSRAFSSGRTPRQEGADEDHVESVVVQAPGHVLDHLDAVARRAREADLAESFACPTP
jgi:hypothetical protein